MKQEEALKKEKEKEEMIKDQGQSNDVGGTRDKPTRPPLSMNSTQQTPGANQLRDQFMNEQQRRQQEQQKVNQFGNADGLGALAFRRQRHQSSLRSTSDQSAVINRYGSSGQMDPLPIDKLPSKIRDIVVRLDEDIAKISTYIKQVALEKDQLTRYQKHLHKLISRRGQYVNWWKAQNIHYKHPKGNNEENGTSTSSAIFRSNAEQLLHYQDYYQKQLVKMKKAAEQDPKFETYVRYYEQKMQAVKRRRAELETRSLKKKENERIAAEQRAAAEANNNGSGGAAQQGQQKGANVMDVISSKKEAPVNPQNEVTQISALDIDVANLQGQGQNENQNENGNQNEKQNQNQDQGVQDQSEGLQLNEAQNPNVVQNQNQNQVEAQSQGQPPAAKRKNEYTDPHKLTKLERGGGEEDPFADLFATIDEEGYTRVQRPNANAVGSNAVNTHRAPFTANTMTMTEEAVQSQNANLNQEQNLESNLTAKDPVDAQQHREHQMHYNASHSMDPSMNPSHSPNAPPPGGHNQMQSQMDYMMGVAPPAPHPYGNHPYYGPPGPPQSQYGPNGPAPGGPPGPSGGVPPGHHPYYGPPPGPGGPGQQRASPAQGPSSHQKAKLKAYIRQHALKYVKAPPDLDDPTYHQWYAGLRKVETIIYQKYMAKQRRRAQEQRETMMRQQGGAPPANQSPQGQGPAPPQQQQQQQQQQGQGPSQGPERGNQSPPNQEGPQPQGPHPQQPQQPQGPHPQQPQQPQQPQGVHPQRGPHGQYP